MVPIAYHDFFSGCAAVAGALIGLLFVAISVSPGKLSGDTASADHQVKAGAAFSALVNTLVLALVALLPRASLGAACVLLASAGLASTAGLIFLLYREHKQSIQLGQVALPVILLALFGLQLANGIVLNGSPRDLNRVISQGGLAIGFFLFAIARAWQLVGAPDTGLVSTIAAMALRAEHRGAPLGRSDQDVQARPDGGPDEHG